MGQIMKVYPHSYPSAEGVADPLAPSPVSSEHYPAIILLQHLRPLLDDQVGMLALHGDRPFDEPAPLPPSSSPLLQVNLMINCLCSGKSLGMGK